MYRKIVYVWNVMFGILYSAMNYNQLPHRSKRSSIVRINYLQCCKNNPSLIKFIIHSWNDTNNTTLE